MKKVRKYFIFILLSIVFLPFYVYAETGSISGNYHYDDKNLSDVDVSIYLIAELDSSGNFQFIEEFENFQEDFLDMSDSKLEEYSNEIYKYISEEEIDSLTTTSTDYLGNYSFKNLENGLYLIKYKDKELDNYRYSSIPILLTVPYNYDSNELIYDVVTKNKVERIEISSDCPDCDNNNLTVPYTYDDIIIYIVLFIMALILIVGLILYINYRAKKENEKLKEGIKI